MQHLGLLRMRPAPTLAACLCLSALAAQAQNTSLSSQTGQSVGLSVSNYKYEEPGLMSLKAAKIGFDYTGTYAPGGQWPRVNEGWFLRGELRYATGQADYSSVGTGSMNNKPDWYWEVRGLMGRDLDLGGYVLAPYIGLGFRQLHSDLRGTTSTGNRGYRRDNSYTFIPVGLTHKMQWDGQAQLHTRLEYAHLLKGRHQARFSDLGPPRSDIGLTQDRGYGLRLEVMRQQAPWSFGPSLSYWQIEKSNTVGSSGTFEPKNKTLELGLKASYQF